MRSEGVRPMRKRSEGACGEPVSSRPAKANGAKRQRGGRSGQPVYSPQLEEQILTRIAAGESLAAICRTPGFPTAASVREWTINDRPAGIAMRYARARERGLEAMADELFTISDDRSFVGQPDASA